MNSQPQDAFPIHRPDIQSVTDAPGSAAEDQGERMRRYFTAMGLRGVCFVLAVVTTGWLRWTFVAGAVVLPYIAVVLANAVGPVKNGEITRVDPRSKETRALTGTIEDPKPIGPDDSARTGA